MYVFFIEKLGFKVDDFPGVMTNVERLGDELFDAVLMYDVHRIRNLKNEIESVLEKAKIIFIMQKYIWHLKSL